MIIARQKLRNVAGHGWYCAAIVGGYYRANRELAGMEPSDTGRSAARDTRTYVSVYVCYITWRHVDF